MYFYPPPPSRPSIAQHKLNLVVARHLCWHESVAFSAGGIDDQFSAAAGPCWPRKAAEAFLLQPRVALLVDYCWSLRLNEPGEVCPSLCEMRNSSPGQKHILGRGFCLADVLRLNTARDLITPPARRRLLAGTAPSRAPGGGWQWPQGCGR